MVTRKKNNEGLGYNPGEPVERHANPKDGLRLEQPFASLFHTPSGSETRRCGVMTPLVGPPPTIPPGISSGYREKGKQSRSLVFRQIKLCKADTCTICPVLGLDYQIHIEHPPTPTGKAATLSGKRRLAHPKILTSAGQIFASLTCRRR